MHIILYYSYIYIPLIYLIQLPTTWDRRYIAGSSSSSVAFFPCLVLPAWRHGPDGGEMESPRCKQAQRVVADGLRDQSLLLHQKNEGRQAGMRSAGNISVARQLAPAGGFRLCIRQPHYKKKPHIPPARWLWGFGSVGGAWFCHQANPFRRLDRPPPYEDLLVSYGAQLQQTAVPDGAKSVCGRGA